MNSNHQNVKKRVVKYTSKTQILPVNKTAAPTGSKNFVTMNSGEFNITSDTLFERPIAQSSYRDVSKQRVKKVTQKQLKNVDLKHFIITKRSKGKTRSKVDCDEIMQELSIDDQSELEFDTQELKIPHSIMNKSAQEQEQEFTKIKEPENDKK